MFKKPKKIYQLVVLLSVSYSFALNDCNLCMCCEGGPNRCGRYMNYNNVCEDGCMQGYYLLRCTHACSQNCKTCNRIDYCSSCKDGYYNGVLHNRIFNQCNLPCLAACKTCNHGDACNECHSGKYGYLCQNNCGKGCQNNQCNFHSGGCNCKPNFTGYQCKNCVYEKYGPDCNISCPKGCSNSQCKNNGECYFCKTGLIGDKCDRCSGGKYGNDCDLQCPSGCAGYECYRNGTCISCPPGFTGYTCSNCIDGYYGEQCTEHCPFGCFSNKCQANGDCFSCKQGFLGSACNECESSKYGVNCNLECSKGCVNHVCNRDGNCQCKIGFEGNKCKNCLAGKYGEFCNKSCPSTCYNNDCGTTGDCYSCNDGFSGKTCDVCKAGRYGVNCTKTCSPGCETDVCEKNGSCTKCMNSFTGIKCEKCVEGKYGVDCNQKCPKTCLTCTSITKCTSCAKGHWGNSCKLCPPNCFDCISDDLCSSCDHGFYGTTCYHKCPSNCFENICNKSSGTCIKGCKDGYYGYMCDEQCGSTCNNTRCGQQFGECVDGCQQGFTGESCHLAQSQTASTKSNIGVTVGASGGVIVVTPVVVITAIIFLRRRKRGKKKENHTNIEENIKENETMTYSEINDLDVTTENNGTNSTHKQSMAYSSINDEVQTPKFQDMDDALYAKPIKHKNRAQRNYSESSSSTSDAVNNPNYEKPEYQTVNKAKRNKPAITSKPIQAVDNVTRKSNALIEPVSGVFDDNDAALEIEEDIESLSNKTKSVSLEGNARKAANPDYADTYYNVGALKKRKIKLNQLSDFVTKKTKKNFADEFQTLPITLIKPYVDSQKRANLSKNRYKGIYPYDDTRVVLKDGDSDYINASYIDGYNKNKAYIASIGPTTKYMGDMSAFWIMVWQENVGKIVMLTKLSEGGVSKCDKYWPDNDSSVTFANILVTCKSEEEYSDYTFRSFIIQKGSISRKIVQVHFTAWPDKGTPDDVTSLIEFREKVNNSKTDINGPILVHCSAGIGRTGTYIALDSVSKEGEAEGEVDIFAFVRNMREQRVNMIQTAEQYQYLHNAIVHTLTFDSKAIQASKFGEYMKSHSKGHLERMFEKLQSSVEKRSDEEKEAVKRNKALKIKNRDSADIPGDRNRPRLYMYMSGKPGNSDYINALYVNGFKSVNRYLIAQTPLPETVDDFLTLIIQEKVSCIISMDNSSSVRKNISIFCPADNQTLKKGAFTVKTERGNGTDKYLLCKMKLSHNSKSSLEEVTIPYIQFTRWGNDELTPEDPLQFVEFVREMELKFYGDDPKQPILVNCSTGAVRSGLFCVVSTLLEKTQIDQEVSVVNTVRQIKYRRHMAIPNKEQYIFCHQCVNEFVSSFDTKTCLLSLGFY